MPRDVRNAIIRDLEAELGRTPTTVEVANRYEEFVFGAPGRRAGAGGGLALSEELSSLGGLKPIHKLLNAPD